MANSKHFEIYHAMNQVNWLYTKGFINRREYSCIKQRLNRQAKLLELDEQPKRELKEDE